MPSLTAIAHFSLTQAAAISNAAMAAGGVVNVACNAKKRHPLRPEGPVVDWDLALMLSVPVILGSVIGALVSQLLPGYITAVLLAVALVPSSYRLTEKAVRMWRAESAALRRAGGGGARPAARPRTAA